MEDTLSFVRKNLTLELDINQEWIDYCTKYNDLFFQSCIGYWAFGISIKEGWLIFDTESGAKRRDVAAKRACRAGQPLPIGYHLIDENLAIRAWEEGVKRYGLGWYDSGNSDANTYDVIIQQALFGEVLYG